MAELGEACSHVASLLWVISVGVEKRDSLWCGEERSLTVTQKSAYMVMLPAIRSVSYAPVKEIDFIGKKAAKGINDDSASGSRKRKTFDIPTLEEKKFLDSLASSKARSFISNFLGIVSISHLHSLWIYVKCLQIFTSHPIWPSYYDLLELSSKTVLTVTIEQCNAVEAKTRDQSNSKLWFRLRAGRVTASKFKSVCHTDPASPSLSLMISICHNTQCSLELQQHYGVASMRKMLLSSIEVHHLMTSSGFPHSVKVCKNSSTLYSTLLC